ncbi:hypothetical protein CTEN210_08982 [Chaetoceros tenuissimus]|uniref:MYND-type domain-containing protein n=1 Tax=Chaetoceros tenuissimus TaxID=426638 RepID=A0AAD3CWK9_9STRA|nr:hypothetical protein CTEN210_08982 [Chaetoceros tenuissimus]
MSSEESCAYCHKRDVPLQACSGCKSVYYCNRSCQKKHWKERNGHKEDCELYAKDRKEWKLVQKARKVGELDIQDRFEWKIHVKSIDSKKYLVLDIDDDEVIGEKELPETKEEICKAIFSFILNPKESWRRAKRPQHSIYIAADSLEFFEPYYKYLRSEFLHVPMTLWREGNESDMNKKFSISMNPRMKWGAHAEGEVYFDPDLELRIAYLSKEERKEYFEQRVKWMSECSTEELVEMMGFFNDMITKKPRFEWREYGSLEECLEEYDELGEWDEEERLHFAKEVYQYEVDYELGEEPRTEEEVCMDEFNARSLQECIWDYSGVPRLECDGSEAAKNRLERAGFELQGYKPGKDFCLSESSVQLGSRLMSAGGIFYEEGASR